MTSDSPELEAPSTSTSAPQIDLSAVDLQEHPWTLFCQCASFAVPSATFSGVGQGAAITAFHALLRANPTAFYPFRAQTFIDAFPALTLVSATLGLAVAGAVPTLAYSAAETRLLMTSYGDPRGMFMPEEVRRVQERFKPLRAAYRAVQEMVWIFGPMCGPALTRVLFDIPEGVVMLGPRGMFISAIIVRIVWWILVGMYKVISLISTPPAVQL